jgi:hypothetical protein
LTPSFLSHASCLTASLIETIVCYLELTPYSCLTVEESRYDRLLGKFKHSLTAEIMISPLITAISALNTLPQCGEKQSDFEVSLLALSDHLHLSPEETSAQLFRLQNQGLLIYSLSRKCIYLNISTQPGIGNLQSFESWLGNLAAALTREMNSKFESSAERVQDVWEFGKIIADSLNRSAAQERARSFLLAYMTDGPLNGVPHVRGSDCGFPFIHSPRLEYGDALEEQNTEIQKCQRQIDLLFKDPSVEDIVARIQLAAPPDLPTTEFRAVVIAKILLGLQTSQIQLADWEHRSQWNSSRAISFPTVLSLCLTYRTS